VSRAAYAHAYQVAPELRSVQEHWPFAKNMRAPGAHYQRPGVAGWCALTSLVTGEVAADGVAMARLLVSHQTPAKLVPDLPLEPPAPEPPPDRPAPKRPTPAAPPSGAGRGGIPNLEPAEIAAAFNARHSLDGVHPRTTATHALAIWRHETTPSVQYNRRPDGTEWFYDHGGPPTRDCDSFALWCLVHGYQKSNALHHWARALHDDIVARRGVSGSSPTGAASIPNRGEAPPCAQH
jgi:hypothetical protein